MEGGTVNDLGWLGSITHKAYFETGCFVYQMNTLPGGNLQAKESN